MKMSVVLFCLCLLTNIAFYGISVDDAWDVLISAVNEMPANNAEIIRLTAEKATSEATLQQDQADLDDLNAQVAAAQKQADEIANAASIAAQTSDVMMRGKMNNIINSTDIPFSVVWPDGTKTAVDAQSTVELNQPFSAYKEGSLIGGVISINPQVNDTDILSTDAEADAVGVSYSLLFNLQGLNEAEFAYGALNYLSVTRYQAGTTRAHSIYLDSSTSKSDGDVTNGLIQDNELWAVDITVNYVTALGDGFIYPRFTTLYTSEFNASDVSVSPNVSNQSTWSSQVVIDASNSATNISTPVFTENIWSDMTGVSS